MTPMGFQGGGIMPVQCVEKMRWCVVNVWWEVGSPKNLFTICSERSSAGRRAAQKPQFTCVNEDFEQRMNPDHGIAVRS